MKLFRLSWEFGNEFLIVSKSAVHASEVMGMSAYMFKKMGWTETKDEEEKKFLKRFMVVSRAEFWPGTKQLCFHGPFTEDEYQKRYEEARASLKRADSTSQEVQTEIQQTKPKTKKRSVRRTLIRKGKRNGLNT